MKYCVSPESECLLLWQRHSGQTLEKVKQRGSHHVSSSSVQFTLVLVDASDLPAKVSGLPSSVKLDDMETSTAGS